MQFRRHMKTIYMTLSNGLIENLTKILFIAWNFTKLLRKCILAILSAVLFDSLLVFVNVSAIQGQGGFGYPGFWNFTFSYYILAKKFVFQFREGIIKCHYFLPLTGKNLFDYFWKNLLMPLTLENILPTPMSAIIRLHMWTPSYISAT